MELLLNLHTIEIGSIKVDMYVPDPESVRKKYAVEKTRDTETPFPFWAKIWPSAFALAEYLNGNPDIIKGKSVLELAGGLGLPSIVAAMYAEHVCYSDFIQNAVDVAKKNMELNQLANVDCRVYNWHYLPEDLSVDILLLSDINYEPKEFDQLIAVCEKFLLSGTTIILTTPGRIMAKDFIDRLDKWNYEKSGMTVDSENPVYVYLLKQ
jgi:predicted nicotinamide N-methyase